MKRNERLENDFKAWLSWNCSTMFMMKPIAGVDIADMIPLGLLDSYIRDEDRDTEEGLYILFKPDKMENLQMFITLQEAESRTYMEDYDYEGGYVVLRYIIPSIYKNDFELFKRGEYSRMSPTIKGKHHFKVIINSKQESSFQYMVFYKDKVLRKDVEDYFEIKLSDEDELWGIPTMEREILRISEIKKKENECNTNSTKEVGGTTTTKRFMSFRSDNA